MKMKGTRIPPHIPCPIPHFDLIAPQPLNPFRSLDHQEHGNPSQKNELSDLELLILSIVYELQYCTASQVRDFLLFCGCENRFKRFSDGNGNPYRNPIHALIRKGLLIPLSIFRGGTASGPSILQLSSFTNKLMELLFRIPEFLIIFQTVLQMIHPQF